MKRTVFVVSAVAALAVALVACGTNTEDGDRAGPSHPTATATDKADPSSSVSKAHNDADTDFAQKMIAHNEGAIAIANLAAQHATTEQVRDLANQIMGMQSPEIETMTTWLITWEEDLVLTDEKTGKDQGGMLLEGLWRQEAFNDLEARSGGDFDRRFLELMTAHHHEAIEIAKDARNHGENSEALELAAQIIANQETQIKHMEELL